MKIGIISIIYVVFVLDARDVGGVLYCAVLECTGGIAENGV